MSAAEIRSTLYRAGRQLRFEMDKNVIAGSLQKYQAIDRILGIIKVTREDRFFALLLEAKTDLVALLPSPNGRFKNLRKKLLLIIRDVEDKANDRLKISDVTSAIATSVV